MRLRTKMLLLPGIAVAAFVAVELVSSRMAARSDRLVVDIEQ